MGIALSQGLLTLITYKECQSTFWHMLPQTSSDYVSMGSVEECSNGCY